MTRGTSRTEARHQRCDYCGAAPLSPCRDTKGRPREACHMERHHAALDARTAPPRDPRRCPWCNDERLDAVIEEVVTMVEEWANEGKAFLTSSDWRELAHAVGFDAETRS